MLRNEALLAFGIGVVMELYPHMMLAAALLFWRVEIFALGCYAVGIALRVRCGTQRRRPTVVTFCLGPT